MLEKNKDYLEMRVSSTDCAFTQNAPTQISVDGYVYTPYMNLPDPGELYIFISKEKFEKLQADIEHYCESAKQWEKNYKALLDKTGFYNLADLMCYLPKDKTLKGIIDNCETENEELKKKLEEFSPIPGYREFLKALYPWEDVEKLAWATEQLCCGRDLRHSLQVDLEYYRTLFSAQAKSNKALSKLVGFSSVEEIEDYLVNEAECDTLHDAISKLHDEIKYIGDELASANSRNNSWKAAAKCNSPKELIEKLKCLCGDISDQNTTIESYKRDIEGLENAVRLTNKNMQKERKREIDAWQKATGCKTPEEAETTLRNLRGIIDEIKSFAAIASNWTDRIVEA